MEFTEAFPRQTIPFKSKGDNWRKKCVDWAAARTYFHYSPVRMDAMHMKVNYDLLNGKIHMEDVARVLNPGNISTAFIPDNIQHYPIINSKINTLRGEESARVFDWKVVVTNPNAVSEIEKAKKEQIKQRVLQIAQDTQIDQQQANEQLKETQEYFEHEYQDLREIRGNELLKHYSKEQNFSQIFNDGLVDACAVSTEAYYCTISGGEPLLIKFNPEKLRVYRNGYSNRIEDADVVVYEDYWAPGRIVDVYYDELTVKQVKWLSDEISEYGGSSPLGAAGNYNDAYPYTHFVGEQGIDITNNPALGVVFDEFAELGGGIGSNLLPYDIAGNIRIIHVWWKSKRKILKVKSYDPMTGEEVFDFYPETYVPDEAAGEEAETLWVNEAWEGTKIGEDIYVGMRPCLVQYNSISNPSKCHFGIVGTIYNINESMPYSIVDMMKPYNYLYDAIHAKLVDLIATNWGKLLELDLALKPKNWEVEKWMYFARANKVLIKDSFNEGSKGAATGKLAGVLNNASKGMVDADWGQSIQNYITLLQWAKDSMSDLVGINRQREGQTYSRETVGGIERAVLQSAYITNWLFQMHDDTKRRVLECFLETAKAAIRGRSIKFQYILSDNSMRIMEIDGDEFCECDYGLVVDNSNDTQKLYSQIDTLAQAALQNQYKLSAIVKLYSSSSMAEKTKIIENLEKEMQEQQAQAQQQQMQIQQQQIQSQMQMKQMEMQQQDMLNARDNETKIKVAEINSKAEELRLGIYETQNNIDLRNQELEIERQKLRQDIEEFDKELRLKEKELQTKKEIETKKIEVQRTKVSNK